MSEKPFLFVGLDYEEPDEVLEFAREINDVESRDFGFKLNADFFYKVGINSHYLKEVMALGRPVFADLKIWNGKRTMASAVKPLAEKGVAYVNVWAQAGEDFLRHVVDSVKGSQTKVLGVTVLTHYNDAYCQAVYGCSLREAVRRFSEITQRGNCDGVINPGTVLDVVRDLLLEKMVPAVRPRWYGKTGENYQEQESYIDEAIAGGARLVVCSTPIRKHTNRKEALIKTLDEMVV